MSSPIKPFVGFFQVPDGTSYSYTVQARSDIEAAERIKMYFEPEYGEETGEIACYSPADLRQLADRLEDPDHGFDVPLESEVRRRVPYGPGVPAEVATQT